MFTFLAQSCLFSPEGGYWESKVFNSKWGVSDILVVHTSEEQYGRNQSHYSDILKRSLMEETISRTLCLRSLGESVFKLISSSQFQTPDFISFRERIYQCHSSTLGMVSV